MNVLLVDGVAFYDWIDCNGVAHFRTLGEESSSYLRLANVPKYLYCKRKVKCSSFS